MYKFGLFAPNKKTHTQAKNKTKQKGTINKNREKKRLAATCHPLFSLELIKGLAEHYAVYWHQASLRQAGVG